MLEKCERAKGLRFPLHLKYMTIACHTQERVDHFSMGRLFKKPCCVCGVHYKVLNGILINKIVNYLCSVSEDGSVRDD